jgi:hypothetical protein
LITAVIIRYEVSGWWLARQGSFRGDLRVAGPLHSWVDLSTCFKIVGSVVVSLGYQRFDCCFDEKVLPSK